MAIAGIVMSGKPLQVVDKVQHLMVVYGPDAKVLSVASAERDYQRYLKSRRDPRD